ncbi:Rho termination factor N-terminal domain-containing protein [Tengunoibacter tsumagoiensis]|uniref:Rho termination factor-like N-terminal domain-containing protein n=1 Tax=Tengunoibacter tsumagoiensis TaxID=2014871 RepID=A0A402A255_9CHLR|nr:Rho termination factor N-terminal domain-containing protein [Tengunoibacter tsumagoiensis]GCE13129.1 hypothetical protein KTT_29880 [Tengunoibacter tsumagoiensis]
MKNRLTSTDLEKMKTHELAELLTDVVLLLKRLPDVPFQNLVMHQLESTSAPRLTSEASSPLELPLAVTSLTDSELKKKTVPELKKIAKELHIRYAADSKKADLIEKIVRHSGHTHSEQYLIQDL